MSIFPHKDNTQSAGHNQLEDNRFKKWEQPRPVIGDDNSISFSKILN